MKLDDLKNNFSKAKNLNNLNQTLNHFLKNEGINTFTFTYYSSNPASRNKVKYDFVSDNIRAWHEYYLSQKFEEIDSELQKARQMILPLYWELKFQLQEAKSKREKQLRQESLGVNVEKGLSIPIHGPQDDFAILLLQQCHGEHGLADHQKKEAQWLAVGYLYYNFVRQLLIKQRPKQLDTELSPRELQCLSLTAKGHPVELISKQLEISVRTVNFHLQNINKKLATRNKYQSINIAKEKGWLD